MISTDPKPDEPSENNNGSKQDPDQNNQSSSPPTKQEPDNNPADPTPTPTPTPTSGEDSATAPKKLSADPTPTPTPTPTSGEDSATAPKKLSPWRKVWMLFKRSEAQIPKPKSDDKTPAATAARCEQLSNFILSNFNYISKQADDVDERSGDLITRQLEELKRVYKSTTEGLNDADAGKEKKLYDLKRDLMKLKLAIPSENNAGAEKKDPLKNLQFSSSDAGISLFGGVPKKLPQLHNTDIFNASMEFKDFVYRYNNLKSNQIKLCLLCFSIFPQGAVIKKRLMVQWWVAEGYAKDELDADRIFGELTEKGFIEPVNVNRSLSVGSCRIHPFNRSALVALAEKAHFFNFEGGEKPTQNFEGCYQACLMGAGLISYEDFKNKYEDLKKKNESPSSEDSKPKLSESGKGGDLVKATKALIKNESEKAAISSQDSKTKLNESIKGCDPVKATKALIDDLEKLHLLMNVDEHILEFIHEWFGKMRNLNILYLGRWKASATHHIEVEDVEFLVKGLENMRRVKFLSLQGVSNIISLPESILKLTDLSVLDLRACYNLESIPEGIGRWLERLTHLDMSECYLLAHMPKSLSKLSQLKVLKGFFVSQGDSGNKDCTLGDLQKLGLLEKLCIYTNWEGFPQKKHVAAFHKLENLSKLTITWGVSIPPTKQSNEGKAAEEQSDDGNDASESDKLPASLTKLDLKCFPKSVTPYWLKIKNLEHTKLKKLYIRGGNFSDLGQYQAIDEPSEVERKWEVEQLRLKYLTKIDMEWRRLQKLFPKLKYLEQVSCPNLTLFPCDAKGVWIKPESRH